MTTEGIFTRRTGVEWALRLALSALFLVSVIGKLYPDPSVYNTLSAFEAKQLLPMGFSGDFAQWFSRTLIGCELALGLLILQPHFYRKLVIPTSILMLVIFCIHLSYEIATKGNVGNCGCFGEFISMTPLQAIIKNVIAIIALAYLYRVRKGVEDAKNFFVLTSVTFASIMMVFMFGMKASSVGKTDLSDAGSEPVIVEDVEIDTVITKQPVTTDVKVEPVKDSVKVLVDEPKKAKSGFAKYFADIDKGKKLMCFFAAGCDHCQQTIKELTQMSKEIEGFPEIRIIFLEEETELIPNFFTIAGKKYPYKILDPGAFYTILGAANTPMVNYLWNGNKVKVYEGTEESGGNYFKPAEFKKIVQKTWKELKK
jgi:hypothetical protein